MSRSFAVLGHLVTVCLLLGCSDKDHYLAEAVGGSSSVSQQGAGDPVEAAGGSAGQVDTRDPPEAAGGSGLAGETLVDCDRPDAVALSSLLETIVAVGRADDGTVYVVGAAGRSSESGPGIVPFSDPGVFVSDGGPLAGTRTIGTGSASRVDGSDEVSATFETDAGEFYTVAVSFDKDATRMALQALESVDSVNSGFDYVLAAGEELTVLDESAVCVAAGG